jgi:hypothetical protein
MDRIRTAGYNIVSIPYSDITPWTIIEGDQKTFKSWGPIWKFTKEEIQPEINKNITAPGALIEDSNAVIEVNAGFSILKYLGLKGGDISAAYNKAAKISIVYTSILKDAVDLIDISKYTVNNSPERAFFTKETLKALDKKGEAALIFSTLKANEINFVACDKHGVEIKAKFETEIVTAKGLFKVSTTNANTLCYKGQIPLVFAYQAIPFWIHENNGKLEFVFSVNEKVKVTDGDIMDNVRESPRRGGAHGSGHSLGKGARAPRAVSRHEEQSRIISPEYVKSLEEKGLLKKQFKSVFKPNYKIYSPTTMIKRVT